jgi:hypothetical protein
MDRGKTLAALAKIGGKEYADAKDKFTQQDIQQQTMERQKRIDNLDMVGRIAGSMTNQAEWEAGLAQAQNMGIDVSKEPRQFDPNYARTLAFRALTAKDQIEQSNKQKELSLKEREVRAKEKEASGKVGYTDGQKKLDTEYAKDYNDFTGGGAVKARDAIKKLKDYQTKLKTESKSFFEAGGGPISGSLPDAFRTQESISLRDNIISVANSALKATFGGQLSDGERKALANEFYNDKLDAKQNLAVIGRKIAELENGLSAQQAKAKYFERNKSLSGFEMAEPNEEKQTPPPNGAQKIKQNGVEYIWNPQTGKYE